MQKNYFPTALLRIRESFTTLIIRCALITDSKCGAITPPCSTSLINAERFTLSFPFQIKFKMFLSTSLTISLCEQIKPTLCIKTGITKDFIIRPRTVNFLQFLHFNLSFIVFTISSKSNFLLRVWSYVKGTSKILIAFFNCDVSIADSLRCWFLSISQKQYLWVFSYTWFLVRSTQRSYLPHL